MGRYINTGLTLSTTGAKKVFFNAAASTQTWTVPNGITCATFELWGGGGTGSPMCCCTCYGGTAGMGGAYALKTVAVTPGSVYTINVGQGGCGNMCYYSSNACGCQGLVTYVTGANLSNLCAEGGMGGRWCNSISGMSAASLAYGGDLNIKGSFPLKVASCEWYANCGFQAGGASPFGGGYQFHPHTLGNSSAPIACGITGAFPGGGSPARHVWSSGWCDCCEGCTGGGADGLVVITI